MNYIKELNSIEKALSIDESNSIRIKNMIRLSYDQSWHKDGPNVDQITAFIAPHLTTQEEAFYAATILLSDVFHAMQSSK